MADSAFTYRRAIERIDTAKKIFTDLCFEKKAYRARCRKMGLGREAVYEGLRRVKAMGAKAAVVGSSQQFYYSLGFVPYSTGTVPRPASKGNAEIRFR